MPAKKARFNTLTSWSYSVYTQYIKCPFSVCLDKIQRVRMVEPPNPQMERGGELHKFGEEYVRAGKAPKIRPEFSKFVEQLKAQRKGRAGVELEWAFDKNYRPTSWFGPQAWLRIKTDACLEKLKELAIDIVDWKSGRVYDEHKQQRSLYALGGLQLVQLGALLSQAKDTKTVVANVSHSYLDTGQTATEVYTMKQLPALKREWGTRIKQMMEDTTFHTKPGSHCRWCRFAKSKGGPCPEKM